MNQITATYEIPAHRLTRVQDVINVLNKRCRRLHIPEITLVVTGSETREIESNKVKHQVIFNTVEVTGAQPKLAGWEFAATFEHDAETGLTIIRSNDTFKTPIPHAYRQASAVCDHCNLARRRNDTFLVYNSDQQVFKQIGRNCLRDFLGHTDPHQVLAAAEIWFALCDACGGDDEGDPDAGWREYGAKSPVVLNTDEFVARAFAVTRVKGFVGRGKARELQGSVEATADVLLDLFLPSPVQRSKNWWRQLDADTQTTEIDEKNAQAALSWVRGFSDRLDSLSDYLHNLYVGCASDVLTLRRVGIVASLPAAYLKHLDRENELRIAREGRKPSNFVGTVGERLRNLRLTCKKVIAREGDFGTTYITKLEAENGDCFTWFASGTRLIEGVSYFLTGTVKSHEDHEKFGKQTILSRCDAHEVIEGFAGEQIGIVFVDGCTVTRPESRERVTFPKAAAAKKFAKKYGAKHHFLKTALALEKIELPVEYLPQPQNDAGGALNATAGHLAAA